MDRRAKKEMRAQQLQWTLFSPAPPPVNTSRQQELIDALADLLLSGMEPNEMLAAGEDDDEYENHV